MYWQRRLTRLELGLYAALIGVLIAVFADRALVYMELAERTAMETTVNQVNAGLAGRYAAYALGGDPYGGDWSARNPFEVARMAPSNLSLETKVETVLDEGGGRWFYEQTSRQLVYVPRFARSLVTGTGEPAIRFRMQRSGPGGRYVLVPASEYRWG